MAIDTGVSGTHAPAAGRPLDDGALARRLAEARGRLAERLRGVDLAEIGISPYNQRYLRGKLAGIAATLRLYDDLLTGALLGSPLPLEQLTLLDYGGGSGVLSLLAKEAGVGTVVYNDIYDVSCEDVSRLGGAIGLTPDHVVCGDVDDVTAYLEANDLRLNAVVSYDVLEHIYDVEEFFPALAAAPADPRFYRLVFASGANIENPRYVRYATRVQLKDELEGQTPEWGHKERDATTPFLELRREMVAAAAPQLAPEDVDRLARATRGLRRDGVEQAVAEFLERGAISYVPDHPTNTCDPNNGNWSEHLMEPDWLVSVVRRAGFAGEIRAGRYVVDGTDARAAAQRVLNAAVGVLGRRALPVAPYYVVYAGAPPAPRIPAG